jgi:hypothetical protein
MSKKQKCWTFQAPIRGTCYGYVTAKSAKEAKEKILRGEWDDVMDQEWDLDARDTAEVSISPNWDSEEG